MTAPPPAASRKSPPTPKTDVAAAEAAIAVRRETRAVASLSDSPSRIVTRRRGSPMRRPIAVAATASGGATTAPIARAAGQPRSGSSQCTAAPTVKVVATTSPTDSRRIEPRFAAKSTSEVWIAAE